MSRIASGDVVKVKPTNNIYTVLAAIGFVVVTTGLVLFIMKTNDVLGDYTLLFTGK